jgi:hypothetical protein
MIRGKNRDEEKTRLKMLFNNPVKNQQAVNFATSRIG